MWEIEGAFQKDVFTFVRIEYDSMGGFGGRRWVGGTTFRLRPQFFGPPSTADFMKVDPPRPVSASHRSQTVRISLHFSDQLGRYVLSTEEMAVCVSITQWWVLESDDFWRLARAAYSRSHQRCPSERELKELTLDHENFSYGLRSQHAAAGSEHRSFGPGTDLRRMAWSYEGGVLAALLGFMPIPTDDGSFATTTTSPIVGNAPGRGRVFQQYSMNCSYPFGINIITYAMSH